MKFSVNWINQFWQQAQDADKLEQQLTSLGLEVEQVDYIGKNKLEQVVVAEILSAEPHPNADKLQVCQVNSGEETLQIVCGAKNARSGIKVPLAKVGAQFGDFKIKKAKLRGVESFGMLCSEEELGLTEKASGLLELPADAPVGEAIFNYLQLDDTTIEIDITPNRGDCLSLLGIAREIAAKNQLALVEPDCSAVAAQNQKQAQILIEDNQACPAYACRIINQVNSKAATPLWLSERLRRSGIRSVSAIVDITNYVMLEIGQPMHAFDYDKIKGNIRVRFAQKGESIILLDESEVNLSEDTLVIADDDGAIAIAGIMGGLRTAVDDNTQNILLESAAFNPLSIVGKPRAYGMTTDSSYRFERGVDYQLQEKAIERASRLIIDICQGETGITHSLRHKKQQNTKLLLKYDTISRTLGLELDKQQIKAMLQSLNMQVTETGQGFDIIAPSYRFDINIEADLVEEIARLYGYENIQRQSPQAALSINTKKHSVSKVNQIKNLLVSRGYTETINYSFIDEKSFRLFSEQQPIKLSNPISSELSCMRDSIWPGLLKVLQFNLNRQQQRVRIFEEGLSFVQKNDKIIQNRLFSALIYGNCQEESWNAEKRLVDFYDIKGDLESVLLASGIENTQFKTSKHLALHPGQAADVYSNEKKIATLGRLHPDIEKAFDLSNPCFLFEIDLNKLPEQEKVHFKPLSRYPGVKRDLALVVKDNIKAREILDSIFSSECNYLNDVKIFDVYSGKGVDLGFKSIAVSISFQSEQKTLTDEDINRDIDQIIQKLINDTGAQLRD